MKKNRQNTDRTGEKLKKEKITSQKTIQVLQQVVNKLHLLVQQLSSETSELSENKPKSDLKINVRLSTQKKRDVAVETVKTLTITWKDNQYYSDFIRYNLTEDRLKNNKKSINNKSYETKQK